MYCFYKQIRVKPIHSVVEKGTVWNVDGRRCDHNITPGTPCERDLSTPQGLLTTTTTPKPPTTKRTYIATLRLITDNCNIKRWAPVKQNQYYQPLLKMT